MKRLKTEYVINIILIIWSEILVIALGLSPVALAVSLAVFYGAGYLFFLFGLLLSIPFSLCIFMLILDEYFDLTNEYEIGKTIYGNRRRER